MDHNENNQRGAAMIAAAIVGAALVLSWGMGRGGARYQIASAGETIVRLDTGSGDMLACNQQRCVKVEAGVSEQRFGPVGIVVDKATSQTALPAPDPNQNR